MGGLRSSARQKSYQPCGFDYFLGRHVVSSSLVVPAADNRDSEIQCELAADCCCCTDAKWYQSTRVYPLPQRSQKAGGTGHELINVQGCPVSYNACTWSCRIDTLREQRIDSTTSRSTSQLDSLILCKFHNRFTLRSSEDHRLLGACGWCKLDAAGA